VELNITEEFIQRFAGNTSSLSNGRDLAKKGKFSSLNKSAEGDLLYGSCQGSSVYNCSVDFLDPDKPVPRCSCPSRQIPCKHAVGLLYCALQGKTFAVGAVPEDIESKRAKAVQRAVKKE